MGGRRDREGKKNQGAKMRRGRNVKEYNGGTGRVI